MSCHSCGLPTSCLFSSSLPFSEDGGESCHLVRSLALMLWFTPATMTLSTTWRVGDHEPRRRDQPQAETVPGGGHLHLCSWFIFSPLQQQQMAAEISKLLWHEYQQLEALSPAWRRTRERHEWLKKTAKIASWVPDLRGSAKQQCRRHRPACSSFAFAGPRWKRSSLHSPTARRGHTMASPSQAQPHGHGHGRGTPNRPPPPRPGHARASVSRNLAAGYLVALLLPPPIRSGRTNPAGGAHGRPRQAIAAEG
jgi:hypothetical protein